ncbi:protease inhibitor I42 family protein [Chloroflexota bacterium]
MYKSKLFLATLILSAMIITSTFMAGCTGTPDEIQNAGQARDVALSYLDGKYNLDAPSNGLAWQENEIADGELAGAETSEFVSGEWKTTVSYPVVSIEDTVYEVSVSNPVTGWYWKGIVEVDGNIVELDESKQLTEEESQIIALQFVERSATYLFDGIKETLRLTESIEVSIPYTWTFVINFDSTHAGYGDRTGRMLAQVITSHVVSIAVEQGRVVYASMDNKWDMLSQSDLAEIIDPPPSVIATEEPDIIGIITEIDNTDSDNIYGRILVELEKPNNTSDKFWVTVTNSTVILRGVDGELQEADFRILDEGQRLDIWFSGPVMESYPAQVSATRIVITENSQGMILPPIDDVQPAVNVEISIDKFLSQYHIASQIVLTYPGVLVVTLGSNPTTGFSWNEDAIMDNGDVLAQIEHRIFAQTEGENVPAEELGGVGAAGKEVWIFHAVKSGKTTLSFEYGRPWESGEKAEWTFELTITVN